jgi:hypothetical protein
VAFAPSAGGSLAELGAAGSAGEDAPPACANAVAETRTTTAISEFTDLGFMRLTGLLGETTLIFEF